MPVKGARERPPTPGRSTLLLHLHPRWLGYAGRTDGEDVGCRLLFRKIWREHKRDHRHGRRVSGATTPEGMYEGDTSVSHSGIFQRQASANEVYYRISDNGSSITSTYVKRSEGRPVFTLHNDVLILPIKL